MDRVRPLQAFRPVSLMSSARRLSRSSGHAEYPSRCARMPGLASASPSFELDVAVEVLEPPIAPELLAAGPDQRREETCSIGNSWPGRDEYRS